MLSRAAFRLFLICADDIQHTKGFFQIAVSLAISVVRWRRSAGSPERCGGKGLCPWARYLCLIFWLIHQDIIVGRQWCPKRPFASTAFISKTTRDGKITLPGKLFD